MHVPSNYEQLGSVEFAFVSTGQLLFGVNKSVPLQEVQALIALEVQV